jgi:hypothetical protein
MGGSYEKFGGQARLADDCRPGRKIVNCSSILPSENIAHRRGVPDDEADVFEARRVIFSIAMTAAPFSRSTAI